MVLTALAAVTLLQVTSPIEKADQPTFIDKPVGAGNPVKKGDRVLIHFVVSHLSGEEFANSKKRGLPYRFRVGDVGNDPMLDKVVIGMKEGGIRTGTIVARWGYGSLGVPKVIAPNEKLLVKVTLLQRRAS